ncbi:MAG: hypothetical protein OEV28_07230 [Nitrospirota bacterium]|nr:hypothetical protein [Nitrospirota bacterium]
MKAIVKELYSSSKKMVLQEVLSVQGLMQILMKRRNTDEDWTPEERAEIRGHLRSLSRAVPVLMLFSLPGGSLLLPVLALYLDRRRKGQRPPKA